eukprot:GEZU01001532.1.p1 GENE.GEZU01001532.1~~GEZU01001532.1.p1  ORF type:complete len:148 (-),score=64.48 GEZU01001532.1:15-458(-)
MVWGFGGSKKEQPAQPQQLQQQDTASQPQPTMMQPQQQFGGYGGGMGMGMGMGYGGYPNYQQMQLNQMMAELELKETLNIFNTMTERCFLDCVTTFHTSAMDAKEEGCVRRCGEKYLKHSRRVGDKFAEFNNNMIQQQQQQQAQQQK